MSTSEPTVYAVDYAIIDAETGSIARTGTCALESLHLQVGAGQLVADLPAGVRDDTHRWDGAMFVELPPRPGPWHIWDGHHWVDPRTPVDRQAALYAARNTTSLDKSELLIRMAMAGMLSPEEAEVAAGGVIPPTIQAALDVLPPEVFPPEAQMVARIKWRSDNVISRVNPVIVLAAVALGVTEEQMDAIFGVRIPE